MCTQGGPRRRSHSSSWDAQLGLECSDTRGPPWPTPCGRVSLQKEEAVRNISWMMGCPRVREEVATDQGGGDSPPRYADVQCEYAGTQE